MPLGVKTPDLGCVRAVEDASPNWDKAGLRSRSDHDSCVHAHTVEPIRDSSRKTAEPVRLCPAPGKPREAYWSGSVDLPNCTQSTKSTQLFHNGRNGHDTKATTASRTARSRRCRRKRASDDAPGTVQITVPSSFTFTHFRNYFPRPMWHSTVSVGCAVSSRPKVLSASLG